MTKFNCLSKSLRKKSTYTKIKNVKVDDFVLRIFVVESIFFELFMEQLFLHFLTPFPERAHPRSPRSKRGQKQN